MWSQVRDTAFPLRSFCHISADEVWREVMSLKCAEKMPSGYRLNLGCKGLGATLFGLRQPATLKVRSIDYEGFLQGGSLRRGLI